MLFIFVNFSFVDVAILIYYFPNSAHHSIQEISIILCLVLYGQDTLPMEKIILETALIFNTVEENHCPLFYLPFLDFACENTTISHLENSLAVHFAVKFMPLPHYVLAAASFAV